MNAVDQRKIDLVPLLQLGLEEVLRLQQLKEFPPGLRIEPDLGGHPRWKIVAPTTSEVIGSFTLEPARMIDLAKKDALDDYTRTKIRNALMNYAALQPKEPQE
jgi:hypothetical protein